MTQYPTREGIAVPPHELDFPQSRYEGNEKYYNNHHAHYSSRKFGRQAVTQCLRDLERHQYSMPVDIHRLLHDIYTPPNLPTEEQAAREIIDAYDRGEMFKRYDTYRHAYRYDEIPKGLVDIYVARYGLIKIFDMAAD